MAISKNLCAIAAGLAVALGTTAGAEDMPRFGADFALELADSDLIASVMVDEGTHVDSIVFESEGVMFSDAVEVEPGLWEAAGEIVTTDTCHAATASIILGTPAAKSSKKASNKSSKKSSNKASKKSSKKSSDKASNKSSHKSSDKASNKSSHKSSDKASNKSSHKSSHKASHKSSHKASHKSSCKSSHKSSKKSSHKASKKASKKSSTKNGAGGQMLIQLHTEVCGGPDTCKVPILRECMVVE